MDDLRDEPFARIPERKETKKKRLRPGTPEFLAYLKGLPEPQPVGEIEGPVVPFGAVPKQPESRSK